MIMMIQIQLNPKPHPKSPPLSLSAISYTPFYTANLVYSSSVQSVTDPGEIYRPACDAVVSIIILMACRLGDRMRIDIGAARNYMEYCKSTKYLVFII